MSSEDGEDVDHDALYNVLNVPKDATEEQIKTAYRKLCQTYHPDKHTDPQKKAVATENFTRVNDAYEVLSEPIRRRVYDEYGMDGVRGLIAEGMEMCIWEDIKARFEKDGVKNASGSKTAEKDAFLSVNNQVKVNVDGTGLLSLLEDYDPDFDSSRIFIASQSMLSTEATAYVTNRDTLTASYSILTRGFSRPAGATVALSGRRNFDSDSFGEVTYIYGASGRKSSRTIAAKTMRRLSERSSAILEATYGIEEGALNLVMTMMRQLSARWMGQLAWVTGSAQGVMCSFQHSPAHDGGGLVDSQVDSDQRDTSSGLLTRVRRTFETMVFGFHAKLGTFETSLSASLQKGLGSAWQDGGMSGGFAKLRLKVGLGFYDVELLGGRNLVQSNSAFGIGVALSTDGVLLRLKVNRGGHKISIPVLLSTEARPGIATGVAALAISVAAVVQVYVVRPIRRAQIAEAKAEARVIRMAGMEKAREDAEAARELMHVTVERSREREEQVPRGGLIITRAFYGAATAVAKTTPDMEPIEGREIELELVDVTDPLQYLVEDSKVFLYSSAKATLMGFWDPTALEDDERSLRVWYQFRNQSHECTVDNFEPLEIPYSTHRKSS